MPTLLDILVHDQVVHAQRHQDLVHLGSVSLIGILICLRQLVHHLLVTDPNISKVNSDCAHSKRVSLLVFALYVDAAVRCRVYHLLLELLLLPHGVHSRHVILVHVVTLINLLVGHLLHLTLVKLLVVVRLLVLRVETPATHLHHVHWLLVALVDTMVEIALITAVIVLVLRLILLLLVEVALVAAIITVVAGECWLVL